MSFFSAPITGLPQKLIHTTRTSKVFAGGVTVTAPGAGSENTKGAWAQIIAKASITKDIGLLVIDTDATSVSGTNTAQLMDIAVGDAASEVVIISNIPTGNSALSGQHLTIPIFIASGQSLSCRIQAAIADDTVAVNMTLYEGHPNFPIYQRIETIGAVTATSDGTDIESITYQEMIAATANLNRAFIPIFDLSGGSNSGGECSVHVAVGAAASEVDIIPDSGDWQLVVKTGNAETVAQVHSPAGQGHIVYALETPVPAGTRISAKVQATDRDLGIVLLGLS